MEINGSVIFLGSPIHPFEIQSCQQYFRVLRHAIISSYTDQQSLLSALAGVMKQHLDPTAKPLCICGWNTKWNNQLDSSLSALFTHWRFFILDV